MLTIFPDISKYWPSRWVVQKIDPKKHNNKNLKYLYMYIYIDISIYCRYLVVDDISIYRWYYPKYWKIVHCSLLPAHTPSCLLASWSCINPPELNLLALDESGGSLRGHRAQPGLNPSQSGLNPSQSGLNPSQSGLNPSQAGLNPCPLPSYGEPMAPFGDYLLDFFMPVLWTTVL